MMVVDGSVMGEEVGTLRFLSLRAAATTLFRANSSYHKVRMGQKLWREWVRELPVPRGMREVLAEAVGGTYREVTRWLDKHAELFTEKKKLRKTGHLSLYLDSLVWRSGELAVDDRRTALLIIEDNPTWNQLRFQFAAAYALEEILLSFDQIQQKVFRDRIGDHPLYAFWLEALDKQKNGKIDLMYSSEGLAPNQPVSLVFQWALSFGYQELAYCLWAKVTEAQREYIGLLLWRRVCSQAKHRPTYNFLCHELCRLNAPAVRQITWQVFYAALTRLANPRDPGLIVKELALTRVEFLLRQSCPILRDGLLCHDNFRAAQFQLALQYNDERLFSLLEIYMSDAQLRAAKAAFEAAGSGLRPAQARPLRLAVAQRIWMQN